ncbi:basic proline-rich protein-like [Micropterus salmoides]|uniref:basic proline-rich protein-like n=1 Tax=Micropterus salmoides TaxID=27706 RepID=UPI0018EAE322|nr:basic proline-rich protein-like [Micropterus salmoides]
MEANPRAGGTVRPNTSAGLAGGGPPMAGHGCHPNRSPGAPFGGPGRPGCRHGTPFGSPGTLACALVACLVALVLCPVERTRMTPGLDELRPVPSSGLRPTPPPPPPGLEVWTLPKFLKGPPRPWYSEGEPGVSVYRPSQTPHLPLSPERVTPGGAGRLTPEARARSGLASPPHRAPAEATRRDPARTGPNGRRSWGDPREGPGARPESPPPTAVPDPLRRPAFRAASDTAPRKPPPGDARGAADEGPARRAAHRASSGGERRATGRLLPQPRLEPSPASHPSPTDPALRANPYPEGQRELTGRRRNRDAFQGTGPSLGANPFQGALPFTKKRELSRGSRQLLRDRLRYRTGRLAAPISATPDSGI